MEIENITYKFRSEIEVVFKNGKRLKISGEWTTTPAFYADYFHSWEKPYQNDLIGNELRKDLMKKITEFSKSHGSPPTPVYFDK